MRLTTISLARLVTITMLLLVLVGTGTAYAATPPTIALTDSSVIYGAATTATGAIDVVPGVTIEVQQQQGSNWVVVGSDTTDAGGTYSVSFTPTRSGVLRAERTDTPTTSISTVALDVLPKFLSTTRGTAYPWLGGPLTVRVVPSSYTGTVTVVSKRGTKTVGTSHAKVKGGWLHITVPTPGVGSLTATITLPDHNNLSARSFMQVWKTRGKPLSSGSNGPYVKSIVTRLKQLHFRISGASTTYNSHVYDAVIGMHKAYRKSRTGSISMADWKLLTRASIIRARHASPKLHIEVDKSRQILMIVKSGKVFAIIPVSTGATGNTPLGAFRILRKNPTTTTWLGPAILFRTMTFHGGFAIHGYPEVPAYPASHGCVRNPMWTADWLYRQSEVGERIYVYTS